jgi:hypothetical protein
MHMILVDEAGGYEAVVLMLVFYGIGIHHKASKHLFVADGHEADQYRNTNNKISDRHGLNNVEWNCKYTAKQDNPVDMKVFCCRSEITCLLCHVIFLR